MPQPFNNAVMTNEGASLLNRAQAGEIRIEFTHVKTGSGVYTEDEKSRLNLCTLTGLKELQNTYAISSIDIASKYSVKIAALISNQDPVTGEVLIKNGYYINEIGLFAKPKGADDSGEIMYSIAVTAGDNGDFMPPYNGLNPAQITQEYYATVNDSSMVTINTSGAAALAEDANKLTDETTNETWKLGVDNGLLYIEKV